MMRGMDAAISGLEAQQTMLDTTANNLANVDTIGYKSQRTTFADELSQTLTGASAPNGYNGGSNAQQVGLGVQVASIDNMMGTGSQQTTGNPLDVYISGNGFLTVSDSTNGTPNPAAPTQSIPPASGDQYTRAGNLKLNSQGLMTTQGGQYVMGYAADAQGQATTTPSYIAVPTTATNINIGQNGAVTYTDTGGVQRTAGYLQLSSFPNEAGLTRDGGSLWSQSVSSGAPTSGTPGTNGLGGLISGTLEGSNVDMATEFANMVSAQTGYAADSKVVTTGEQMMQTLTQMPLA